MARIRVDETYDGSFHFAIVSRWQKVSIWSIRTSPVSRSNRNGDVLARVVIAPK